MKLSCTVLKNGFSFKMITLSERDIFLLIIKCGESITSLCSHIENEYNVRITDTNKVLLKHSIKKYQRKYNKIVKAKKAKFDPEALTRDCSTEWIRSPCWRAESKRSSKLQSLPVSRAFPKVMPHQHYQCGTLV